MKVLLVEDEVALADVLIRNLRARGHDVKEAQSADRALLRLAEDWPDALVLDIDLPDENGWDVLRRIGVESRKLLRVIIISAEPISQKYVVEFRPAYSFQKPFPIEVLARALADSKAIEVDEGMEIS
jgi:DNA-binding response OmpR family regulator